MKANPKRGERSDFKRICITMSPEMIKSLKLFSLTKDKDSDISSIVREAIVQFLNKQNKE